MKIYNIINIPKGLSQEMECDCREEYYSGMTAGEEAQKAKLVSTAITENGTYEREDGFNQVDVNVIEKDVYFPVNPMAVGSGASRLNVYIYTTGCTLDTTRSTIGGAGNIIGSFSEIQQSNSGSYYVTGYTNPNPTDKFRFGFISGKFYDTDGNLYTAKPCAVSQRPGPENQDYNSGYTAGKQDLIANIQGDYYTIPEGTTKIRPYAFNGVGVIAITIPDTVKEIGYRAFETSMLTALTIPSSVKRIDESAFANNRMKEIIIPDSVQTLGVSAFESCIKLTAATLPSNLTSIPRYIFARCESLTGITLPTGITSIGESAFYNCSLTGNIVIPSGVTSIGSAAFGGCSGLTSMTFESPVPASIEVNEIINDVSSLGSSAYTWPIYVPCESVEEYRAAWPYYAHRISCPDLPKIAPVSVNEDTPETGNDENASSSATDNIPK